MFKLYANKTQLTLRQREPVTSGSVNVYRALFEFSPDWEGLERMALFRCGGRSAAILLDESGQCVVPWEVLSRPGYSLEAGVYGARGGETVLPTVWANLGMVLTGACAPEGRVPPTPELWEQALARKGDGLTYDGQYLSLTSGGKALSTVTIAGGGEGGPSYQFGHGLKLTGNTVSVDAVDDFKGDNTLPMTAAGVQVTVGNIEALLGTI